MYGQVSPASVRSYRDQSTSSASVSPSLGTPVSGIQRVCHVTLFTCAPAPTHFSTCWAGVWAGCTWKNRLAKCWRYFNL